MKPKVLIIGRDKFQEKIKDKYFLNEFTISRCRNEEDIKRKCQGRDLIVAEYEERAHARFFFGKKIMPKSMEIEFRSINPFRYLNNLRKLLIAPIPRIIFLDFRSYDVIYHLDNGKAGYLDLVKIMNGALAKSFMKRAVVSKKPLLKFQ